MSERIMAALASSAGLFLGRVSNNPSIILGFGCVGHHLVDNKIGCGCS